MPTLINKSKGNYKEKAFTLKFKRRILSIQLTEQDTGKNKNKIILIDDISEITAAQRNEAWSEVARRLAHEIKNPLTPIQLSAERIDHKFSKQLEKDEKKWKKNEEINEQKKMEKPFFFLTLVCQVLLLLGERARVRTLPTSPCCTLAPGSWPRILA